MNIKIQKIEVPGDNPDKWVFDLVDHAEWEEFYSSFKELQEVQNTSAWVLGVAIGAGIFWFELLLMWAITHGV